MWTPRLDLSRSASGEVSVRVGHELVDEYLHFLAGRARPNSLVARNVQKLDVFTTPRLRIRGSTLQGGHVVEYVGGSPAVTASTLQPTKVDACVATVSLGKCPDADDARCNAGRSCEGSVRGAVD